MVGTVSVVSENIIVPQGANRKTATKKAGEKKSE
jgi:hypothetical protein